MENRTQSFLLKEDKSVGFRNAVKNGQFRLALEYSVSIIEELENRIIELEDKLDIPEPKNTEILIEETPKVEVKKPRIVKKENEAITS